MATVHRNVCYFHVEAALDNTKSDQLKILRINKKMKETISLSYTLVLAEVFLNFFYVNEFDSENLTIFRMNIHAKLHSLRKNIIRIYHECEGGIEKSVPRITDWHHEVCRMMTNGDSEGWIFLTHPHMNFLLTTTYCILY